MPRHVRNLLLIAALCWVVPAAAQLPASEGHECPYAGARAAVTLSASAPDEISVSPGRRALLP